MNESGAVPHVYGIGCYSIPVLRELHARTFLGRTWVDELLGLQRPPMWRNACCKIAAAPIGTAASFSALILQAVSRIYRVLLRYRFFGICSVDINVSGRVADWLLFP